jgi:AhpD family alkylhydroperoxidase
VNTGQAALFFPLTIAAAPDSSKPLLEEIRKSQGFIPNLMAVFANSPSVLEAYRAPEAVWEDGSFHPRDRQLILLAASVENHCKYCIAAHSTILKNKPWTPREVVSAIRNNRRISDAKIDSLVTLVRERGHARQETIQKFIAVGYGHQQVMELLIGIALKTISNYLEHICQVPEDEVFRVETPMKTS